MDCLIVYCWFLQVLLLCHYSPQLEHVMGDFWDPLTHFICKLCLFADAQTVAQSLLAALFPRPKLHCQCMLGTHSD